MDNREITPEYEAALKEHGDLQITCQQAMLRHLYQTAALLTPEQSQRYLQTVLPCALDFSPDAPGEGHHH
jgi:Spy/CpxP family protein refolding chaperone